MSTPSSIPIPQAAADFRARLRVRRHALAVVCALAVAAGLRFADLAGAGYWHDEIFTVNLVRLPFGRMLHEIPRTEGTPPLYYVVAWLWSRLFGTSEAGLRSLSALAGVLTVVPVYAAGRLLFRPLVGVVAAVLAATSPLLVWYGQEARSYELGILAVASSLAAVAAATRRGLSPGVVAVWTGASLVGLATHYFTVFAIVPEALWLLRLSRGRGRRIVAAGSAVVAVEGAALVPLVLAQRGNPAWIAASGLAQRTVEVPSELLAGPQPSVALLAIPILALSLAALALVFRREPGTRGRAGTALGIGAAVVLVPFVLAVGGADFFLARNVVFAWPFLFVAVAAGVTSSRLGLAAGAAIIVVNLCIFALTAGQPKYGREDWRSAAASLGEAHDFRAIVLSPSEGENVFQYYRPRTRALIAATTHVDEVDVVGLPPLTHRIGRNPVPPRPIDPPRLAGFHVVSRDLGGDYTVFRLRAPHPTSVGTQRLLALALDSSPVLLVERP